jgi:hypothetical protein
VSQNKSHRNSAEDARTAAAASDLPNVRERSLRSADAHDAEASRQETAAANLKVREAEIVARAEDRAGDVAADGPPSTGPRVCAQCNGTGEVGADLCATCGGFGTLG